MLIRAISGTRAKIKAKIIQVDVWIAFQVPQNTKWYLKEINIQSHTIKQLSFISQRIVIQCNFLCKLFILQLLVSFATRILVIKSARKYATKNKNQVPILFKKQSVSKPSALKLLFIALVSSTLNIQDIGSIISRKSKAAIYISILKKLAALAGRII